MPDYKLESMIRSMLADMEAIKKDEWGGDDLLVKDWYNLWWHYEMLSNAMKERPKERSTKANEEGSFRVQGQLY